MGGITEPCVAAVQQLLQFRRDVTQVRILSHAVQHVSRSKDEPEERVVRAHCLLFNFGEYELMAVKSGFSSGYGGEGPSGFSYVLQLLNAHGLELEEYEVTGEFIQRLDQCLLTDRDLDQLDKMKPVRDRNWSSYIREKHERASEDRTLWRAFPRVIPYSIIDPRIIDLALSFWENPSDRLRTAFVRLEDCVRERTGLIDHGAELFRKAFLPPTATLEWKGLSDVERGARATLFEAAYRAHRNPRAHRELKEGENAQLSEFLVVNHLLCLERSAKKKRRRQTATPLSR
jgi:hypothetical protein